MTLVRPLVVAVVSLACATAISTHSLGAQSTGPYTQAQASAGATLYTAQCSMCHGANLEGGAGPALAGGDFIEKWSGQTADDVHSIISQQMPQTNPGSLTPDQSLALMAYILQQNKYPAGDTPLTVGTLKSVKIVKQTP